MFVGGLVVLVLAATRHTLRYLADGEERDALSGAVSTVLAALSQDPTPQADWAGDPVWSLPSPAGVTVRVRDVSSGINPNYVRKALVERSVLASLLSPGDTPGSLQQDREDEGLSTAITSRYSSFFRPEAVEYLCGYGFANVNTTDEFVLRSIVVSRTGDEAAAEYLRLEVQQALQERRVIGKEELELLLGLRYREVTPLITTEPQINVNFADPRVLRLLAEYPAHVPGVAAAKVDEILSRRGSREITAEELATILAVPPTHPLLQYLGARTWFWEIVAQGKHTSLTVVAARVPEEGGSGAPAFRVVEEGYR
jgi:hypothetical protein